jgi:hypothetical protein
MKAAAVQCSAATIVEKDMCFMIMPVFSLKCQSRERFVGVPHPHMQGE